MNNTSSGNETSALQTVRAGEAHPKAILPTSEPPKKSIDPTGIDRTGAGLSPPSSGMGINRFEGIATGRFGLPIPKASFTVRGTFGTFAGVADNNGLFQKDVATALTDWRVEVTTPKGKTGVVIVKGDSIPALGPIRIKVPVKTDEGSLLAAIGLFVHDLVNNLVLLAIFIVAVIIIIIVIWLVLKVAFPVSSIPVVLPAGAG